MKKPKVIIIGADGMLGQALHRSFEKGNKYELLAWDRNEIDISDEKMVGEKIRDEDPSLIINAAAYNAVDRIEEDAKVYALARKINSDGPKFLALAAKRTGAVLVHYISDYVFDGQKKEYLENDLPCPISRYGETKLTGEENVRKTMIKHYLIRTSKLFGTPARSEGAKKSFFAIMLELAKTHQTVKAVDEELSCFTFAADLAEATRKLVEKKFPFGTYHMINEGAETWYSALKSIFAMAGVVGVEIMPVTGSEFPRPARRPAMSVLKNTKFPHLRPWKDAAAEWLEEEGLLKK